ncbi:hypothetical protein CHLNCDRAFT_53510 [Chlorella variabilis]|uniref:hydroxyethylthiazole kinase n=1 Tax=Chlorella variabilis TaxID=554065 RepID=E1ZK34_CHLVA|nr:hypothetical protein CHLNCDRAFT_53510 [Chlorella variabilis]EFN53626.1 hypothetical protein CHLNCDRAFT_53510 [Chlorella variabilis]|eukprot:XP_005845728.1 hypothetical protein CHLNCDRAFT_53510 [Chlorella variabilis]
MANTLLAAGASPAMAHSIGEVEDFVALASAVLINVGTLSEGWVGGMKLAAARAGRLGKPWVLDPVGCGATPYRSKVCAELMLLKPAVVRGNASEILALAGAAGAAVKGVDSTAAAAGECERAHALGAAKQLAARHGCVVAVSGAEDLVTDGSRVVRVANGVPLLQQVTATGLAAQLAVEDGAVGPGSLRVGLLDSLWTMTEQQLREGARVLE